MPDAAPLTLPVIGWAAAALVAVVLAVYLWIKP